MAQSDFSAAGADDPLMAEGYALMEGFLRKVDTGTRQRLAVDYAHTFLAAGNYETYAATPFESVFTSEAGLLMQDARDEVYRMYCDAHVQPDERLRIPEDHVAFEFEFLALAIERTNDALEASDFPAAAAHARTVARFHEEHQLNWIDDLCDAIEDVAATTFYCGVAKVTRAFVHRETGLVADEVAAIEELVGDKAEGGQERTTA